MRRLLHCAVIAAVATGVFAVVPAATASAALPSCNNAFFFIGQENPPPRPWYYMPFRDLVLDCVLGQGNQGKAVKALQNALIKCYGQGITRDGVFGSATKAAVRNAQNWEHVVNHKNVTVDGVYGPQTRNAMMWPMYGSDTSLDNPHTCRYIIIG